MSLFICVISTCRNRILVMFIWQECIFCGKALWYMDYLFLKRTELDPLLDIVAVNANIMIIIPYNTIIHILSEFKNGIMTIAFSWTDTSAFSLPYFSADLTICK